MREGERIGDSAVAGDAAGKSRRLLDRGSRHQRLDALVHIAEALFEPHHGLAAGGEAEVPGLDDAGMHRPDRDLVQAFAFRRQEGIGRPCGRRLAARTERMLHVPEADDRARAACRARRSGSSP